MLTIPYYRPNSKLLLKLSSSYNTRMTSDQYTNTEFQLAVGNGHELYVHDWGNQSSSMPIVQLHGGPGGSSKDRSKSQYDPERQRVIFFDQRGCGRSTPYGSLEHNTTAHLIDDINRVVDHLDIKKFVIRGGSWGSCLALAYTIEHPLRVNGLVLDGIFTGSQAEIDWLELGQFRTFYPDAWQKYLAVTPNEHHNNPTAYHSAKLLKGNIDSAWSYSSLQGAIVRLDDRFTPDSIDTFDPTSIVTEQHYMSQLCFMPDRHILENASHINVPVVIVQGRYDMMCPPATAYELHQALPNSTLHWTQNGHVGEHEAYNLIKFHLKQLTA